MTREEILQMEAGPEMNALIAEWVMEWKRRWYNNDKKYGYSFWYDEKNEKPAGWLEYDIPNDWNGDVFKPSEEISAAWPVFEEHLVGWMIASTDRAGWYDDHRWMIWFGDDEPIFAPTAPLAICRAALLATMDASC